MSQERIDNLAARLEQANAAYRAGEPTMSDARYDELVEELRGLAPEHPWLHQVEAEDLPVKDQVRHPSPMLSTEKAYQPADLERWVERVRKAAVEQGIDTDSLVFRMTPKLDGLAGRDDGQILATRGNGRVGYDISSAWDKGLVAVGGRGQGVGEIVLVESWFNEHLADAFDHPRNVAVGIVKADEVNQDFLEALQDEVVRFVPYSSFNTQDGTAWEGSALELLEQTAEITARLREAVDYPLDGMVVEVLGDPLRAYMGATSHHHRWQIALKERGELVQTVVNQVVWQTGRTGNVTPVMEVEPVRVSGATVSRVTAHHAGMIRDKGIGPGARIEIIRSGEVIPKLEEVLSPVEPTLVSACPSCGTELSWRNDFLVCEAGLECPAQVEAALRHWFRTLRTADFFGPKTIARLVEGRTDLETGDIVQRWDRLPKVYDLSEQDLRTLGFGPGQTKNLLEALQISRSTPVEDARWLAAFGIRDLGVGDSRKLLAAFHIEDLGGITAEQIAAIKGFGEITSQSIAAGLERRWPVISEMLSRGFNLERTPLAGEAPEIESPVAGKRVLFTGKMVQGTRDDMKTRAKALGAVLASGVSKNLDLLVIGEKASPAKVEKARKAGVEVLTEAEYLARIGG